MKNKLIALFYSLICISALHAQQNNCAITLRGSISLSDSEKVDLRAATIYIQETKQHSFADSSGIFTIQHLCPGIVRIKVEYVGYNSVDTVLNLKNDVAVVFYLTNQLHQLSTVVVTTQVLQKDQLTIANKDTIGGIAIEETRGLSLGESLKSIAGVNSIQSGPNISKPVIHGVYSNRILIINNGVRQEGQTWGNDHAPEIDPFIATKYTIIKGPASIRYGSDAIGGVVIIDPQDMPTAPGIDGNINLVGMSNGQVGVASGMIEEAVKGKLNGLSWRLQGTIKEAGNAQAAHYYLGNTGFNEDDYSATVQYTKEQYNIQLYYSEFDTKIGIATASVVGSISDLYEAFARTEPSDTARFTYSIVRPYQTVNHKLYKASGFLNLPHKFGKIEFTYAYQRDIRKEYDADPSYNSIQDASKIPDLNFELNTQTADLIWEHPRIGNKIVGSIGLNFITHGNVEQGTSYSQLIPNFVDYGGGIFGIEKYEVKKWTFEAGLRYDYRWLRAYFLNPTNPTVEEKPTYNWQKSSVDAGVQYKFNDHLTAMYNFGTAWRPPQVIELFANGIHQSAASYEIGDSALTLEKAFNNELSFIYATNKVAVEAGYYINYYNHYIYLKPDSLPVQTLEGAFPAYNYTQVNALFQGVDLSITYNINSHFSLVSKTSIVRARNLTTHDWLVYIPADRFDNSIRYHWDSIGKWKNFFAGITNLGVSRQGRVPINSDYVAPPPGYDLWGAEIGWSVPFRHQYMDFNLTVTNLTNVAYRDYLNRFRYFVDDLGRNISVRLLIPLEFGKKNL